VSLPNPASTLPCFAAEDGALKAIFGSGRVANEAKTQAGYALIKPSQDNHL